MFLDYYTHLQLELFMASVSGYNGLYEVAPYMEATTACRGTLYHLYTTLYSAISYSYTTVRVWCRSYYTSMRRSQVRVLITMISYEYTWYNWLVPCQKTKINTFPNKTRSIYSTRAVGRSIQLTVLLEYIDLCKLICAPRSHSCFGSLYQVLN